MNRRITHAIAIAFALTGSAGLAQAQTDEIPSTEVRIADLDLSSPAGRATLDRRVKTAARRVCEFDTSVGQRAALERCKSDVRQQVAAALRE